MTNRSIRKRCGAREALSPVFWGSQRDAAFEMATPWPDFARKFFSLESSLRAEGLVLHNLGILNHIHAILRNSLARYRNRLCRQGRQFRINWFVLADEKIRLAVACFDTNGQTHFDARFRAICMFGTSCFVVETAGQVDDLAGYGDVFGRRALVVFTLVGQDGGCGKDGRRGQGCYDVWLHAATLPYAGEG